MRKCVAFIACVLLQSTGAFAGDFLTSTDGWSGFSVGAGIGAKTIDQNATAAAERWDLFKKKTCFWYYYCDTDYYGTKPEYLKGSMNDDAWKIFGTVQVGYDRLLFDRVLIGAFADYDFHPEGDEHASFSYKGNSLSGDLDRAGTWTVGGRLGYLVTPRFLVYGLGGFSRMNQDGSVTAAFDGPKYAPLPTSVTLTTGDLDGWTTGGGIETKLDRIDKRLSLKVEYRYSRFEGDSDVGYDDAFNKTTYKKWWTKTQVKHWASEGAGFDLDEATVQSVRAVLVWKLQADPAPIEPLK